MFGGKNNNDIIINYEYTVIMNFESLKNYNNIIIIHTSRISI